MQISDEEIFDGLSTRESKWFNIPDLDRRLNSETRATVSETRLTINRPEAEMFFTHVVTMQAENEALKTGIFPTAPSKIPSEPSKPSSKKEMTDAPETDLTLNRHDAQENPGLVNGRTANMLLEDNVFPSITTLQVSSNQSSPYAYTMFPLTTGSDIFLQTQTNPNEELIMTEESVPTDDGLYDNEKPTGGINVYDESLDPLKTNNSESLLNKDSKHGTETEAVDHFEAAGAKEAEIVPGIIEITEPVTEVMDTEQEELDKEPTHEMKGDQMTELDKELKVWKTEDDDGTLESEGEGKDMKCKNERIK